MKKTVFISTSIPYVNAYPHVGFALEIVQADTLARFYRLLGNDVFFLTGTDENAIKNVESAEKLKVKVKDLVKKNSKKFQELKNILNLSFDYFIRTTAKKHIDGAQKFWKLCQKDIYKKNYRGLYCSGCEVFYKDEELKNNFCPAHNKELESVEEENYFFALSKYQSKLEEFIKNELDIYPQFRKKEVLNFVKKGLKDFSISRPTERTKGWGIPVPEDESQRIYVWFDALINYLTGLGFNKNSSLYNKFWLKNNNRFQLLGKDIVKFHAIYWPAMLMSAKVPLPKKLYVHGFINVNGKKMSKSLGNVINPFEIAKRYPADAIRYYLLSEIPSLSDGNFSYSRMKEIYNSDLANELGNLVSRITNLLEKDNITIKSHSRPQFRYDEKTINLFEKLDFNQILEDIWQEIKNINKEIDSFTPWKKSPEKRREFLLAVINKIWVIGFKLQPFMPQTGEKIIALAQGKIKKFSSLFPKIK